MTALIQEVRRVVPAAMIALGLALSMPTGAAPSDNPMGLGPGHNGDGNGNGNKGSNGNSYLQHNLISDQAGVADNRDANLVNPWGIALNPNAFVWVADNGTGVSTLYDGYADIDPLVVTIPTIDGPGTGVPTGITFNGTTDFAIAGTPSHFLFATEDGVIAAWSSSTAAVKMYPPGTTATAVYKGVAIAGNDTNQSALCRGFP